MLGLRMWRKRNYLSQQCSRRQNVDQGRGNLRDSSSMNKHCKRSAYFVKGKVFSQIFSSKNMLVSKMTDFCQAKGSLKKLRIL